MPNNELVNITNCHEDCERLFEVERELQDRLVELDCVLTERDTWAIAAEIVADLEAPDWWMESPCRNPFDYSQELATAYAIAEAYGEGWRMELEAK